MVSVDARNAWYDRWPCTTVTVGHRRVPVFRSMGVIGAQFGMAAGWLAAARAGIALTAVASMLVVAAIGFFGWGLARRALTGVESIVLLEHVWITLALEALYFWAAGLPVLVGLDVFSIALGVFLAWGRLGCLAAGCCHGTHGDVGVRYDRDVENVAVPVRLRSLRLRPVQLYEAVGLVVIALVGLVLVGGAPGLALTWFLASYALLRFGTESLRGDERPHLGPVSLPRAMAMTQALATAVGYEVWVRAEPLDRAFWMFVGLVSVAVAAGWVIAAARAPGPLVAPRHLDEAWALLLEEEQDGPASDRPGPRCRVTSQAMSIATSPLPDGGLHVSLSHATAPVLPVAYALAVTDPIVVRGIVHFRWIQPSLADHITDRQHGHNAVSNPDDIYFATPSFSDGRDRLGS